MRVDQHLAGHVLEIESHPVGIRAVVRPTPATLRVPLPLFNIDFVEKARRVAHRAIDQLLTLRLAVNLNQAHGHAADRYLRGIREHAVLAKDPESFEEEIDSGAEADHHAAKVVTV